MLQDLVANAERYLQVSPWLAVVAVFVGGLLTASNPCVLAMIPLMLGFVAGQRPGGSGLRRAFGFSLLFVLGLSLTYTALGMLAALAGRLYGDVSGVWRWLVGGVCLVMGLHLLELVKVPIPMAGHLAPRIRGPLGALVLGLLFGVVSAPCAAPLLVVLLTWLAAGRASVPYGALLLFAYALGHSVLILVAGTSMGLARAILESKRLTRATDALRKVAGAVIIVVGVFFVLRN